MISGRSLELFFIDGRPDGMLTAEVFNWTGHVLKIPRTQLREGLAREESGYTGVYLLLGQKDDSRLAYIGEAEDLRDRIKSHAATKDWWDEAILITSAGNNLHKAHVKYLESRLVEIARDVGAVPLENNNLPPRSSQTEAAVANMESFLDYLGMVLPAIRVDLFLDKKRSASSSMNEAATESEEHFVLSVKKANLEATSVLRNGEMIVLAGSGARSEWVGEPRHPTNYQELYRNLRETGVIEVSEGTGRFTKDYAFTSPSAAGAIVTGRSINGRISWIHSKSGKTYAEWEAALISEGIQA